MPKALFLLKVAGLASAPEWPHRGGGAHHKNKESPLSACLLAGMMVKELHVACGPLRGFGRNCRDRRRIRRARLSRNSSPPPRRLHNPAASTAPSAGATRYTDLASDQSFVFEERGRGALLQCRRLGRSDAAAGRPGPARRHFLQNEFGRGHAPQDRGGATWSPSSATRTARPPDVAGRAAPLDAPPMPASLDELRKQSAARLSKLAGHEVTIFGTAEFADSEAVGRRCAHAMSSSVSRAPTARLVGSPPSSMPYAWCAAKAPSVTFKDGELVLGVNPRPGLSRPRHRPDADLQRADSRRARPADLVRLATSPAAPSRIPKTRSPARPCSRRASSRRGCVADCQWPGGTITCGLLAGGQIGAERVRPQRSVPGESDSSSEPPL